MNSGGVLPIARVKTEVCDFYKLDRGTFDSDIRTRKNAWPRQVAMALALEVSGATLATIGREFGRDHSTVCYARQRVQARCDADPDYADEIERLRLNCMPDRGLTWVQRLRAEREACASIGHWVRNLDWQRDRERRAADAIGHALRKLGSLLCELS